MVPVLTLVKNRTLNGNIILCLKAYTNKTTINCTLYNIELQALNMSTRRNIILDNAYYTELNQIFGLLAVWFEGHYLLNKPILKNEE